MAGTTRAQKLDSFNFRLEPELKTAFTAAAEAEDRPAAQVLREFMRGYVEAQQDAKWRADMRRSALVLSELAKDPTSDEAQVLRELDANLDDVLRDEPDY